MPRAILLWATPLLLALTACPAARPNQPATSGAPAPPAALTALADFRHPGYAQYRGRVAGAADSVTLCLTVLPDQPGSPTVGGLVGTYYGADGEVHDLQQLTSRLPVPDSLALAYYAPLANGGPDDQLVVRWQLRRQPDGRLLGTVGGQAAALRPVRPALAFTVQEFADSVAAFPGQARSPYGRISLQTLVPVGPSAVARAVAAHLGRIVRGDSLPGQPAPALPRLWQQRRAAFSKEYRADAAAMAVDPAPSPANPADFEAYQAGLRYENQSGVMVVCQQGPLLSVRCTNSEYSGGAHGNFGSTVHSFDLRTGRWLTYGAIFRPEARRQLPPLLDRGVRRALGLGATERLDSTLLVKEVPVTRNVCLVPGGVLFVYSPYEIAAYALGEVQVFVPLAEVRPLLRPGLPLPARGAVARR